MFDNIEPDKDKYDESAVAAHDVGIDIVIVEPTDNRLLHALTVCEVSHNNFAFLRTQKRSLERSIKRLSVNQKHPPTIIYKNNYVLNPISVLNRLKETLPKDKFKSKNNIIQCDKRLLIETLCRLLHD
ncbi:Baculovirus repeated orf A [Perigonia lusca single nucleopolyhedrovirus]|uniref:Baculovirus repeated orf A n=1 Tax=Perigonia lusca single nucleopolyhedrovirus TaxID=1675865 RepID=A0A0M3WN41_9ABAC|nr:Baculovirus repeated orf A [Perigonia lusca single nucleopolyhedrovirus]AKN80572.1 Baculovirus repeated orf A [Perigonia lusca single nucleopolyhedrovirus]